MTPAGALAVSVMDVTPQPKAGALALMLTTGRAVSLITIVRVVLLVQPVATLVMLTE